MFWGLHDIATVTAGRINANRYVCWDLNSKNKTSPGVFFLSTHSLCMRLPVQEAGGGAEKTGFIRNSNQVDNVTVRLQPDRGISKMPNFCTHSGVALL